MGIPTFYGSEIIDKIDQTLSGDDKDETVFDIDGEPTFSIKPLMDGDMDHFTESDSEEFRIS